MQSKIPKLQTANPKTAIENPKTANAIAILGSQHRIGVVFFGINQYRIDFPVALEGLLHTLGWYPSPAACLRWHLRSNLS